MEDWGWFLCEGWSAPWTDGVMVKKDSLDNDIREKKKIR